MVIDACSEFLRFEPTATEIIESHAHYNKPMAYGQRNYYSFDMATMKDFIEKNCRYIKSSCWDDVIKHWTTKRNSDLGFC